MSMHPSENIDMAKEAMMNEGGPCVSERGKRMKHRVDSIDMERAARRAGQHARAIMADAGCEVKDLVGMVTGTIRNKPFHSLATAAGIGIVAGMLYRRS